MLSTFVMLAFTAIATLTDARRRKIYNWTTYPGILAGVACRGIEDGWAGVEDSLLGLLVCGGVMVFCFVLFPDLGGGDVKLIAMLGAGLGLSHGILAMLWTFVIGFIAGVAVVIWRDGAMRSMFRLLALAREVVVTRGRPTPVPDADSPLNRWLFLGPAALAAVVIVRWPVFAAT
jgi:prepilin peptidase CpaA